MSIPGADVMVNKLTQQLKEVTEEKLVAETNLNKLKTVAQKAFGEFNEIRLKYDKEKKANAELRQQLDLAVTEAKSYKTKLDGAQQTLQKIVDVSKVAFKEFNDLKEQYEIAVFTRQEAETYAAELLEHVKTLQQHNDEAAKRQLSVNNSALAEEVQKLIVSVQAEKDAKAKVEEALKETQETIKAQTEQAKAQTLALQQRIDDIQASHMLQLKQQQEDAAFALAEATKTVAQSVKGSVQEEAQKEISKLRSELLQEQQNRQNAEARALLAENSSNNDRIAEFEKQIALMRDLIERTEEKLERAEARAEDAEKRIAEAMAARNSVTQPDVPSVEEVLSKAAGIPLPPPPPTLPIYNPQDRPTLRLKKRSQMTVTGQPVEVMVDPRAEAFAEMISRIKSGAVLLKKTHAVAPPVAGGQMNELASILSLKPSNVHSGNAKQFAPPINDELSAKLKKVRPASMIKEDIPTFTETGAVSHVSTYVSPITTHTPSAGSKPTVVVEETKMPASAAELVSLAGTSAGSTTSAPAASTSTTSSDAPELDYDQIFANIEAQLMSF